MRRVWVSSGLLLIALSTMLVGGVPRLHAQQGTTPGYRLLTDPQTTGAVLTSTRAGGGTATALLRQACSEVASFFDGRRPMVLGGFRDGQDQRAEGVFRATVKGAPVAGVMYAIVAAGAGTVDFAFDSPGTVAQTLPRLMQLVGGGSGPAPPSALNWRDVPFPDRSGWMRLPDGWLITFAQKGMVAAAGPHGMVERGVWGPVYTRAAAQAEIQASQQRAAYIGIPPLPFVGLVADPTDPVSVLYALTPQLDAMGRQTGKPPTNILRIIEVASALSAPTPAVSQSAFIDYEFESAGVRYRSITLLTLGTVSPQGMWIFVLSYVASRVESFAQNLPILMEIWGSAKTAQWVYTERLENAMRSLREAGQIWEQTTANRQRAEQRMHDKWTEVFRGTRIVEDTETGRRTDVNLGWSTEIVRRLNQSEGYERYREIPLWELNQ